MYTWAQTIMVDLPDVAGQIKYTTPGTYTWTVPAGVFSVSAVVIAAGGQGTAGANATAVNGGQGGGLRYRNSISVTPGQQYTIVVGHGGITTNYVYSAAITDTTDHTSSALGLTAGTGTTGTTFSDDVKGGYGGTPFNTSGVGQKQSGGGAAGTYTNGTVRATTPTGGTAGGGTGLYGLVIGGASGNVAGDCGGGGMSQSSYTTQPASSKWAWPGGSGGVRIIWGRNRGFPLSGVDDV